MTSNLIPYTHWAYFTDRAAAKACGAELDATFDCLATVDRSYDDDSLWVLRAARTVGLDWPGGWHDEIAEVVERHGGKYDGGEATLFVRPAAGREA